MLLRWTIGDVVRKLRKERGWSQRQFAKAAGMAASAANRLEKTSDLSDQRTIKRAADALELSVSALYRIAEFSNRFAQLTEGQQILVLDVLEQYERLNDPKNQQQDAESPQPAQPLAAESASLARARQRRG